VIILLVLGFGFFVFVFCCFLLTFLFVCMLVYCFFFKIVQHIFRYVMPDHCFLQCIMLLSLCLVIYNYSAYCFRYSVIRSCCFECTINPRSIFWITKLVVYLNMLFGIYLFTEFMRASLLLIFGCIWSFYITRRQCLKYVAKEEVHDMIIHSNVLLWNVLYLDVREDN